jgi:hypothetical protein
MKRALMVGINDYCASVSALTGCVADAWRMFTVLSSHEDGSQNFECMLLANPGTADDVAIAKAQKDDPHSVHLEAEITAALLQEHLHQLFTEKADIALFYFAGHGTVNNLGGYLVTYDFEPFNPGVSMPDLITLANNAKAAEVVIIIDCCHSGKLGEVPILGNENAILREGVSILTGTAASQPAIEENGGGLFTNVVYEALNGVATDFLGRITVAGLYTYVEQAFGAWRQRPLYRSNVRRMVTLRKAAPPVAFEILRNISKYFLTPDTRYRLDPSYEPTDSSSTPEHTKVFADLQTMRNAGLVVPVDAEHMYYAAMNSTACKLTLLGRYYWRLAKMKRFGVDVAS